MKHWIIATAWLIAASPAFAQTTAEKTGASPLTPDFVKDVAISDLFEIQSSELAVQKSPSKSTKDFAERMIKDHSKTSSDLKSLVTSGKVPADIPSALDSTHQSKLDKLKTLSDANFDKQYHKDQEAGHKDAVSLFKRYAAGGDNADLKNWASQTLPILREHLKEAEHLNK